MPRKSSIAFRAGLAVVLLVGFYVLALGIAFGLLWLLYAMYAYGNTISIHLTLLCLVGAAIILWSIVPRPDRFEPPGPPLRPEDHPQLFAAIRDVAKRTGQKMPAEVYLIAEMNAWVAQRGGFMGFFSRRVMGLGLSLLEVLNVSQLQAVLAHEFGHFHGGDTRLGPWIYKTRAAISRTVIALAEAGSSILHKPFEWYGLMFLRVTQAVSRQQEFTADELSAKVVGAQALIEGLKAVHGRGLAFDAYWENEFVPVVDAGYRPPLAQGFRAFMASKSISEAVDKALAEELRTAVTDPYDTHPPLKDRIAALEALPPISTDADYRRATDLLGTASLEDALLESMGGAEMVQSLKSIDWTDVPLTVFAPIWKEQAAVVRDLVSARVVSDLPMGNEGMESLAVQQVGRDARGAPVEMLRSHGAGLVGAAIAGALLADGWTVAAPPGEPVVFQKNGAQLEPFNGMQALASGDRTEAEWRQTLETAGIARLPLA